VRQANSAWKKMSFCFGFHRRGLGRHMISVRSACCEVVLDNCKSQIFFLKNQLD
jgi:hypothetical protein